MNKEYYEFKTNFQSTQNRVQIPARPNLAQRCKPFDTALAATHYRSAHKERRQKNIWRRGQLFCFCY